MWYIVIGIIVLGVVAAIAGYFRNRKLQKMLERGEISEIPEAQELVTDECCGQHETCERDSLLAAVSKKIEYYDDEELDRFRGVEADAYDEDAVNEFRDVLYTLQEIEVAGWLRSLQLRAINLPDELKDEAFLIVIKFHNHETKVPLAWNNSFIGMEQEFPYNETEVSCRETIKKDIRG